ncbi:DUF4190 domain-containing protein [Pseudoclavibacter sp. 13-3]|uniref:DUF4190 domain-containing protein n=1 Tax=Pseudoclavibacter sp. 13-3 TaxID=2901228 RepID=UPI001E2C574B|nr:DUF4190 domain-containing protein [Pseudoclavibacter sp. 13-3]MCD7101085.1 DUF4190 domain-containing protein [Pseudoclavibacter sp. 13-3]
MSENTPSGSPRDEAAAAPSTPDDQALSRPRPAPQYGQYAPGYDANTQPAVSDQQGWQEVPRQHPAGQPQYGQYGQAGQNGQPGQNQQGQYGQQNPYGTPVPAQRFSSQGGSVLPSAKTNVLSIISLICGVLSVVTFFQLLGLPGIAAVITGHIGLSQIKRRGEQGRGMGLAGLIMGYITVAVGLVLLIVGIILVVMLMNDPSSLNGVVPPDQLDQLRDELDGLNV